jgi:hypothetical protein
MNDLPPPPTPWPNTKEDYDLNEVIGKGRRSEAQKSLLTSSSLLTEFCPAYSRDFDRALLDIIINIWILIFDPFGIRDLDLDP